MTQNKTERHVMFASTILLMLFVGLTLFVGSIARANPGPDSADEMRDVPRSRRRWLRGRKEHERSGPSLTGSPEAARFATCSNHFRW